MTDEWTADTSVRRRGCSPADLLSAVQQLNDRYPSARLIRNGVGNMSVVDDGAFVAMLDLTFGRLVVFGEE